MLVAVLSWWPADIFSVDALAEQLRQSLGSEELSAERIASLDPDDRYRVEALAQVASAGGDLQAATRLYRDLGSPEVFGLLRLGLVGEKPMAGLARESIRRLFEIDDHEACNVLVEHYSVVTVRIVVEGLAGCDNRWKHEYLKRLFAKDEVVGAPYHMQMVELYAEYEPQALLNFLRASERYPLQDALQVCRARGLLEEEAYLLGKAGHVNEALKVLLEQVGDVGRAVQFAAEYQDPRLWEFLISFVLERPHLLVPLLDHLEDLDSLFGEVGKDSGRTQPPQNAKPAHVLRRLPPGTPVSRIALIVGRVFKSVELSKSLTEHCNTLSRREVRARKRAIIHTHSRGTLVAPDRRHCSVCGCSISQSPPDDAAIIGKLPNPEGASDLGPGSAESGSDPWVSQALANLRSNGSSASSHPSMSPRSASGSSFAVGLGGFGCSGLNTSTFAAAVAIPPAGNSRHSGVVLHGQCISHARCYEVSSLLGRTPTARFPTRPRAPSGVSDSSMLIGGAVEIGSQSIRDRE